MLVPLTLFPLSAFRGEAKNEAESVARCHPETACGTRGAGFFVSPPAPPPPPPTYHHERSELAENNTNQLTEAYLQGKGAFDTSAGSGGFSCLPPGDATPPRRAKWCQ